MKKILGRIIPRTRRERFAIGLAAGGLLVAGVGAGAYAALTLPTNGVIHACVNAAGIVRIINPSASCFPGETAVSWNQTGPTGPAGATGAVGPSGPAGPQGPAAPAGPMGPSGPTGATGAMGATGLAGPAGPAGSAGPAGAPGSSGPGAPNRQHIGTIAITGTRQGPFTGDGGGPIPVVSYQWSITSPRDPASGLPAGKRMHHAFTFVKPVDSVTPLLMNAIVNNENLTTLTLTIAAPGSNGETLETFHFQNASISSVVQNEAGAVGDVPLEEVMFTYQKVTETVGSRVAEDDFIATAS